MTTLGDPPPAPRDREWGSYESLALNRTADKARQISARVCLYTYAQPLHALASSFSAQKLAFSPPNDLRPMNPSVIVVDNEIIMVVRAVNYSLSNDGLKISIIDGSDIHTRNFLLRLSRDFAIVATQEIHPPPDLPPPQFHRARGLEDMRLFWWQDSLWSIACFRELTAAGWCEQVIAHINRDDSNNCYLDQMRVLHATGPQRHEKNWIPFVQQSKLRFIYSCDPLRILDQDANTIADASSAIAAEHFRGGSQAISFDNGWLALVHEAEWIAEERKRIYLHRFIWMNNQFVLQRFSRQFFFVHRGVEFSAGLSWHPDNVRLLLSFGVGDGQAWVGTIDAVEVSRLLEYC